MTKGLGPSGPKPFFFSPFYATMRLNDKKKLAEQKELLNNLKNL